MLAKNQDLNTMDILVSITIIAAIIIAFSIASLWLLTKNIYLDAYYTLETFFEAPNAASSFNLAELVMGYNIYNFAAVVGIVIIDNIGRLLIISFIIAAVLDMIAYANIERLMNIIRAKRLKGHVIICGYNPVSEKLIERLRAQRKKIKFIVLDSDENNVAELHRRHIIVLNGSCTSERDLKLASVEYAKSMVMTSQDDISNLISAIEAKKVNKNIKVIARVSKEEIRTKMYRVGVDMCVLPEYLAGITIGETIAKRVKVLK
ncbi:MAG: potassium channel family protein [Candidatus Micrarchaeia archaeon]